MAGLLNGRRSKLLARHFLDSINFRRRYGEDERLTEDYDKGLWEFGAY